MTLHEIIEEIKEMDRGIRFPEDSYEAGQKDAYWSVLDLLTKAESEEKAVDLEEHYKQWLEEYMEQSEGYYPTAQAIALHFYELGQQSRPKLSDNSVEEEIENYFNGWCNADDYGQAVMPDCLCAGVDDCKDIARHFYELGCRHTAVMYDDIEYERQRAEEAELSDDLEEEEINRYLEPIHTADIQFEPFTQMTKCARHFAEWGAEHLKK